MNKLLILLIITNSTTFAQSKLVFNSGLEMSVIILGFEPQKIFYTDSIILKEKFVPISQIDKIIVNGKKITSSNYINYWSDIQDNYKEYVEYKSDPAAPPKIPKPINYISQIEENLPYVKYCQLLFTDNSFLSFSDKNKNINIIVDWGSGKYSKDLKDKNGESITFYSPIDGINYFARYGWRVVNTFMISNGIDNGQTIRYLMEKQPKKIE